MSTSINQNITSGLGSPQNWADLFIESSYIQEQSKHIVHNVKDILNEKNNKMERQLDDIRVLVAEAKIRNNFNDDELAAYIGLSKASLAERKSDPRRFTLNQLYVILELCGKELKFVEKAVL